MPNLWVKLQQKKKKKQEKALRALSRTCDEGSRQNVSTAVSTFKSMRQPSQRSPASFIATPRPHSEVVDLKDDLDPLLASLSGGFECCLWCRALWLNTRMGQAQGRDENLRAPHHKGIPHPFYFTIFRGISL